MQYFASFLQPMLGNIYLVIKTNLPQDGINLELCSLLGIYLAMKEEVIEEQEEGMKEKEENMGKNKERMEEQEEVIEEQGKRMKEQEEIVEQRDGGMEKQENIMEEDKPEKVLSVTIHGIKYAIGKNFSSDSFNTTAELTINQSDNGPQAKTRRRGHPKNISSERTQLTKGDLTKKNF